MKNNKTGNIITIANHPAFEKTELTVAEKTARPMDKDMDFIETLFRFLGDKRHIVIAFIRMKLDARRRKVFTNELELCQNLRQQARCAKKYISHLKVSDAKVLLMSLPEMLPGKIKALIYHGEASPENRLMKFAKTFGLTDDDAMFCMFFFLMTRPDAGQSSRASAGRAI